MTTIGEIPISNGQILPKIRPFCTHILPRRLDRPLREHLKKVLPVQPRQIVRHEVPLLVPRSPLHELQRGPAPAGGEFAAAVGTAALGGGPLHRNDAAPGEVGGWGIKIWGRYLEDFGQLRFMERSRPISVRIAFFFRV